MIYYCIAGFINATCNEERHHRYLLYNSKTRLFVLHSQNYAAKALPRILRLFLIPHKNLYLNQATRKIPELKISNPKKCFDHPRHLTSPSPLPHPPPGRGTGDEICLKMDHHDCNRKINEYFLVIGNVFCCRSKEKQRKVDISLFSPSGL